MLQPNKVRAGNEVLRVYQCILTWNMGAWERGYTRVSVYIDMEHGGLGMTLYTCISVIDMEHGGLGMRLHICITVIDMERGAWE